jgi:3-keto-5-aminohexanoate cleavage enzyme
MTDRFDRGRFNVESPRIFWPVHLEPKTPEPDPLIIMTAPVGGVIIREQNPNQPYSAEEITAQVKQAYDAGAQIHHFHVRDEMGFGSERMEDYYRLYDTFTKECPGMLVSLNLTRPLDNDSIEERFDTHDLSLGDTVIINLGSMNVGPKVFINSEHFIVEGCRYLEARGVKPELAVYNQRMLSDLRELLIEPGIITPPYFINMCMGIHSAIPATIPNLYSMLELMPEDATWLVSVGGRNWLPMLSTVIALGGHVRVGMEDNVFYYPHSDEVIDNGATPVKKMVQISEALGRPIATIEQTKQLLGLPQLKKSATVQIPKHQA